jgi:beta-glucosidase
MNIKTITLGTTFSLASCSLLALPALAAAPQLEGSLSIPAVIAAMTLQEKAALVSGTGMNNAKNVPGAAGSTLAIPRLGIPQIVFADGPVGVRLGAGPTGGAKRYATGFPVSVAMAASWNPELVQRVAGAIGEEASAMGVDLILGPAINIQRSPLNGRNFEYFSEDPLLNAHITAAYITGLQNIGVGAVLKHFVANNQETRRQTINEIIPERALHEIYFPGFEYAMAHAQPWAVMSSYPAINGTPASQNSELLQQTLRDSWGFKGFVMSDWYGVSDPVRSLLAGNDLNMPGGPAEKDTPFLRRNAVPEDVILAALKSGEISEQQIDSNIQNILNVIVKTHTFKRTQPPATLSESEQVLLTREAASEAMVLLKNEQYTLPLNRASRIAAFGSGIQNFYVMGGGSAEVNIDPTRQVGLAAGLRQADFALTELLSDPTQALATQDEIINQAAQQHDIALISLGRSSTEGADRFTMAVRPDEIALIKRVAQAFHQQNKKLVVLLNVGSPIEVASWEQYADAILLTWLPGEQAGHSVADILSGQINPSGRLPQTFPKTLADSPDFGNFPGNRSSLIYGEGIYVGYRGFDSKNIAPMYPFGYGLSYSSVHYHSIMPVSPVFNIDKQNHVQVSIEVTNRSSRATKEVVQLYVTDNASRLDRPLQELKAFRKVSLEAGEQQQVKFQLNKRDFSYYDSDKHAWVLEPGRFTLRVGSSSRNIHAEMPLLVVSATPAFSMDSPWIDVQTYEKAAEIVAQVIGENETISWINGSPSLNDKLEQALIKNPELKTDAAKRQQIKQSILDKINAL